MLSPPPVNTSFDKDGNAPSWSWVEWVNSLFSHVKYKGSGETADRPTNKLLVADWYYDTTLSKPIWWDGAVWRDAAGTSV